MNDLISREEVYKALTTAIDEQADIFDAVKAIPSADRPSGEWIDRSDGGCILNPWWETYECSKCGQYGTRIWNFCPNCGSKMRGEHDD